MAINWPSPASNGDTYTYAGVTYTYSKTGTQEGFWTVISVSATINAAADFALISPTNLNPTVDLFTNNVLVNTLNGAMDFTRDSTSTVVN